MLGKAVYIGFLGWHPPDIPPSAAAAGTYCPALTVCRVPQSISGTTSTCCPIAGTIWTADECAASMTCDASTKKCVCPANQDWCLAAGDCLGVDGKSKTESCSCDFQCKGSMTCQNIGGNNQCACPVGQDWCAVANDCKVIDSVDQTGACFCDLQCKGDMTCNVGVCGCTTGG